MTAHRNLRDAASQMRRRLTIGYVLALTLIALLTLSGSALLSNLVLRQNDASTVINRAGAQRMLSQRIAALAEDASQPGPARARAQAELEAAIGQMQASEQSLTAGPAAPARRTEALRRFYFEGPAPLDPMVRRFLITASALALTDHTTPPVDMSIRAALRAQALGPLLTALKQAVSLHQAAAAIWVDQAIRFHWVVVGTTLLVLLLEAFFIFAPLTREVYRLADRLDREARRDALTGLLNRRAIGEALTEALNDNAHVQAVSVIAIDLDHFKEVNDAEGHAAGDSLLRATAERMASCVRAGDLLARIGGDEFAVFLIGVDEYEIVNEIATRIRDCLHIPVPFGSRILPLGATLGVAIVPRDADSPQDGMRAADEALIRAKLSTRGGIGWASRLDTERVARVAAILRAFDAGGRTAALPGLSAHFQPIFALRGVADTPPPILALEALTRWHHPVLGDIPPTELIDALGPERAARLGQAVRAEALCAFARLRVLLPEGARLGVNLSAGEVARQEMIGDMEDAVRQAGLTLRDISIEITEQVLLERVSARIIDQLAGLRGRGARLVLDDFGTGNAGLLQLLRLNLDGVKLDRRFVQTLGTDGRAEEVVRATLSLAHSLKLQVIAEGVETHTQAAVLCRLGCDAAQGYLFAKPMSEAALRDWLKNGTPSVAVTISSDVEARRS